MTEGVYHRPVLCDEAIRSLSVDASGTYLDATFGGGGHARAILEELGEDGRLIAFDRDEAVPREAFEEDPRIRFIRSDFRYAKNWLRFYALLPIDGL